MKSKPFMLATLLALILSVELTACSLPNPLANNPANIPYTPYEYHAANTEDILNYLEDAMQHNEHSCNVYVTDKSLINVDHWLNQIDGIEQIHCEYITIGSGYNLLITIEYWDNAPIIYAYKQNDLTKLNDRQLELYYKYCEILQGYTSSKNSPAENELNIHDYLVTSIDYDKSLEAGFNAYDALINGRAICSGYTECFKTFMDMLNIDNITISGVAGEEQHIWNAVKLDNDWYQVDVTWDDPLNSPFTNVDHSYFNITDDDMAIDHTWDENQPGIYTANGTYYNYPKLRNLSYITSQSALNSYITKCIGNRATSIEFTAPSELDIKASMSLTDTDLTYSYKAVERAGYVLYVLSMIY
jgi:transglutaminase/protease-like cytokinesis protein 3